MFGEYISSHSGTVDTLTLSDGRQIQVSAVDGDTPYIVSGNNAYNYNFAQTVRSNPAFSRQVPQQLEFIEYARGMDGQSVGPQYSGGSSRRPSKSSNQTSGSRRGQSLIPQEQSGKQSNRLRARRATSQSRSSSRNRDTFSRNVNTRGMSTTVDLQSIRNNQNLARQMLANISNAGVNAVNAYLALRALEGYAEDPTTAQNAADERQMYANLRIAINQAMNNPERIRRFVEEEAPNYLIYAQSSYEDRKNMILRRLGQ